MKKIIIICTILVSCVSGYSQKVKANNETMEFRYEVEATTGQAVQGFTLVKIFGYSKSKNVATQQTAKNAVHAILFKGVAAYNDGNVRIAGQRPLISDATAYNQNKEFFEDFFADGGDYQRFVQLVNNGIPGAGDIIKIGKEYKVGMKVLVNKDALRKYMEEAGIIKKLGSGF